jgi:hypothetical protein
MIKEKNHKPFCQAIAADIVKCKPSEDEQASKSNIPKNIVEISVIAKFVMISLKQPYSKHKQQKKKEDNIPISNIFNLI